MTILCTIDLETREVSIPSGQCIAAYDHNVDVIRFQAETIPGFSLDTSTIRIAAQGPNKARHDYAVDPSTVQIEEETGYITFDWPIPAGVTEMPIGSGFKYGDKGQLIFAVCAEIIDGSTVSKAWHSDDGIITVVAHLEPESGGGEDPEEEATNAQKIGQLQTATAILQREISGIASGTPPTADSTDDMDHEVSTVYINTTDGKWYYWDGTVWVPGGTYGGAVTSTTFNQPGVPADDFAVGEALADKADADDLTALGTRVTALEQGGIGASVPIEVRQAIYTLLNSAVYTVTGLEDEIETVFEWANATVTDITLNKSTLTFNSITSETLIATVVPADSGATVNWSSSDTSVATVHNGVVTSVGNGTCVITASAGSVSTTCAVTVSGLATTYSVTNNLTNCSSSNAQITVEEGTAYTAIITADSGYVLDSVTCTMGGTAQTVTGGVISIASVTGNIVITASASLDTKTVYYDWDFTSGLIDSVGSLTATLKNNASQDSSGLHLTGANDCVILDASNSIFTVGRIAEFTVGTSAANLGNNHGRLFTIPADSSQISSGANTNGVIYRNTGKWSTYVSSWGTDSSITDKDAFANSVIKLHKVSSGASAKINVYLNDELIMSTGENAQLINYPYVAIGSTAGNTFHDITITRCRIYTES